MTGSREFLQLVAGLDSEGRLHVDSKTNLLV